MPFDSELVLLDGSVALDPTSDADAISTTVNAYGNIVLDVKKTAPSGLVAVMVLPTAPTTYLDTLTVHIQHSNHYADGWQTIASFPVLYALVREMEVTPTTAFLGTDIGLILTATTDSTSDGGVILDFDGALLTAGQKGRILVQMSDANDDYSTAADTVTATSGQGVGTQGVAAKLSKSRSYGIYAVRFQTNRRYVRGQFTVTAGGDFGKVQLFLTDNYELDPSL